MGVNVHLTPIYGSQSTQHALSNLLTVDDFNILLDCGWASHFDPVHLENLATLAPTVNAVLISHPDLAHIGALPYAVAKLGLDAPIFSTLPVWRMAQMFMYDAFLSKHAQTEFDVFNLDDVDSAFELAPENSARFHLLKYQQHFPLDDLPKGADLVITPHPAGHLLGGTVWSIKKHTETILYAVHFNHRRERHLNPTSLPSFSRPSHLIVSATKALTRTDTTKPAHVVEQIRKTVSRNGNVLIPVDTAGRVVELAVHLHDAWDADPALSSTTLVVLHELSTRTFDFARSMIEWMSDEVVKRFDISRENLFIFKHIKLCQSLKQLESIRGPLVVLASSVSMEMGFSRILFAEWCQQPSNSIILVDRPEPNTLYSKLYEHCLELQQSDKSSRVPPLSLQLTMKRKEFLQGEELEQWREEEKARKALEEEQTRQKEEQIRLEKEAKAKEEEKEALQKLSLSSTGDQGTALGDAGRDGAPQEDEQQADDHYDKIVISHLRRNGYIQSSLAVDTFQFSMPSCPTWDHYGQVVDTTRFMIGEDPGEGAPSGAGDAVNGVGEEVHGVGAEQEEIPTKYVEEVLDLVVQCRLAVFDCTGLSDGDSLKRLIKDVEPRHVTLIAGTREETEYLQQHLISTLDAGNKAPSAKLKSEDSSKSSQGPIVITPSELETVDITSHTSVFDFTLQDSLVKSLSWNPVSLSSIAFVDAMVTNEHDETGKQILAESAILQGEEERHDDMMDIEAAKTRTPSFEVDIKNATMGHPTLFVGTIMLGTLRDKLNQAGMKTEFAGGALCIENTETGVVVLLKKVGAQHIVVEGALSEEYLAVKDILYDELVIPR